MDSKKIIKEIEERYPAPEYPSLHLDDPMTDRAYALTGDCWGKLYGVILPIVPRKVLNPLSAEYFWRTRKEWFGMSLGDLEDEKGGEKAWEAAKEPFSKVAETLKEHEGPFFLGDTSKHRTF
jgi:glutathione S-transferase